MMLSDRDLRATNEAGEFLIVPFPADRQWQPASIDLRIAEGVDIAPGAFVLASTLEWVRLGPSLVGRLEGKSTWARRGLFVHITAGFIDPGFEGTITLELLNVSGGVLTIPAGSLISQLSLHRLSSPAERPYGHPELGSHYFGQTGTTPAVEAGQ